MSLTPQNKFWPSIKPVTPDFAGQVLDLEMAVEMQSSVGALKQLLELYSVSSMQQAIEYYEAIGDERYDYYKLRMRSLISRKENLFCPGRARGLLFHDQLYTQRKAERLIRKHNHSSSSASKQLQANVESQSASLTDRLVLRRSKHLRSSSLLTESEPRSHHQGTHSAGSLPSVQSSDETVGQTLEHVLENSLMSRHLRLALLQRICTRELAEDSAALPSLEHLLDRLETKLQTNDVSAL